MKNKEMIEREVFLLEKQINDCRTNNAIREMCRQRKDAFMWVLEDGL